MWHKPCRTFHPWCPCIKTRCLFNYDSQLSKSYICRKLRWSDGSFQMRRFTLASCQLIKYFILYGNFIRIVRCAFRVKDTGNVLYLGRLTTARNYEFRLLTWIKHHRLHYGKSVAVVNTLRNSKARVYWKLKFKALMFEVVYGLNFQNIPCIYCIMNRVISW